jgi:hydroxylaminobenzene mutase
MMSVLVGLVIPYLAVPRLGLSTHLVGLLQGLMLIVFGFLWPRLALGPTQARIALAALLYESFVGFVGNLLAGVWGAGNSIVPLAAGSAHGTPVQEAVIVIGLRSAGVALIVGLGLVLWGLRGVHLRQED